MKWLTGVKGVLGDPAFRGAVQVALLALVASAAPDVQACVRLGSKWFGW